MEEDDVWTRRRPRRFAWLMARADLAGLIAVGFIFGGYGVTKLVSNVLAPVTPLPVSVAAPECRWSDPATLADRRLDPTRSFVFRGVTYGIRGGQAECSSVRDAGLMQRPEVTYCEFSHPLAVVVTTPAGVRAFEPGPTRGATVYFVEGEPRCASGSRLSQTDAIAQMHRRRAPQPAASR